MDLVVAPNFAGLSQVPGFGRINAGNNAITLAMFGVLADGHIYAVLVKHGCGVDLTGPFGIRVAKFFAFRGIAIVFPNSLQKAAVTVFHRLGIERIAPAITAAKEALFLA